jgi:Antitoxin VbhA
MLTEAERMERREAVESAIGTHRAEGISLDETVLSLMDRFANGEFTLGQFSAAMDSHAETVVSKDKQLAGAA